MTRADPQTGFAVGRIRRGFGKRQTIIGANAQQVLPSLQEQEHGKGRQDCYTIDVAARYFVYKLNKATDGQPNVCGMLRGMNESRATIARAVERGWVSLEGTSGTAALTDEGRRLAHNGLALSNMGRDAPVHWA